MSVIVAVVSSRDGVIASDGRRFGPARLEKGQIVQPALVESDEFDKTFELDGGKVIGAFCGLMCFSGRTIAEHIAEMVGTVFDPGARLASIAEQIAGEMADRLSSERDVALPYRKVDLLLVGGERLTRSDLRVSSVRFHPQNDRVTAEKENPVVPDRRAWYRIYGEDKARAAAENAFKLNQATDTHASFLEKLAKEAIRAGIGAAGPHEYGSDPACGGHVFTRRTWYP